MGHSVWVGLAETASRIEDPTSARRPPVQHQAQPGVLGVIRQAGGAGSVRCFHGGKVPASAGLHCRRAEGGQCIRRRRQIGLRWPQGTSGRIRWPPDPDPVATGEGVSSWPCGQHSKSESKSKSNSNSQCYMMGVGWVGLGLKVGRILTIRGVFAKMGGK